MDILIVLLVLVFIFSLIGYVILSLLKKENNILNKVIFISYTGFCGIGAIVNEPLLEGIGAFLTMEILFLFVLNLILIIKNKPQMFQWLLVEVILMALYTISYIFTNPHSTQFIDGLSEGAIYPIAVLYMLVVILFANKRECKALFTKILAGYYGVLTLAFSFGPPLELANILVSIGFMVVVGFILGLVLFIMYKTAPKFPFKKKEKEKGDFS